MAKASTGINGLTEEDSDQSDTELSPLYDDNDELDQRTAQETKGWNLFREIPVKKESGSMASTDFINFSVKALKVLSYIFMFVLVLGGTVIARGTLLFSSSQIKKGRPISHCNKSLALDQQFVTVHSLEERITWLWAMLMIFAVPELGMFLRSVRIIFFKTAWKPSIGQFFVAFIIETLQTIGTALLMLFILPELDVVKGAMLMNAACIVPGVLNALTRDRNDPRYTSTIIVDVLAISAQATAFVVWPLLDGTPVLWCIPVACVLISLGWWENFVGYIPKNNAVSLSYLCELRDGLKKTRYYTHMFVSVWKIVVFMCCILISLEIQDNDPISFFTKATEAFGERPYNIYEVQLVLKNLYQSTVDYATVDSSFVLSAYSKSAIWVALIQITCSYISYGAGKVACRILIQKFSFTFALALVGPVCVNLLILFCGIRNADPCAFRYVIPEYLFFDIPPVYFLKDYIGREMAWIWLLWLLSQFWISMHAWFPRCERLASTDKLFVRPWYNGAFVDLSLLMNRTKEDENEMQTNELNENDANRISINSTERVVKDVKPSDSISRIYVCATMWHETREEMMEFLKSIFRIDEDQSARRVAQKYLGVIDPDYYEVEAHIFMDDAFEISDHNAEDSQVNRFVKCLVDTINEAASEVHLTNVRLRSPKKYPTPYGGKLVWTLPGKNKMICHLKDKSKIRHRKRWSQVMYMYYFLGHRLMDLPLSVDRKEVMAENTFLLALDGDIDFKPSAVILLVDLMKKEKNLGAACGRIHPVGSGFISWYQMFEYAIGHWLQKATEHMIGCVLCSPGCFSLFRAKALMDDNVMRKYTTLASEARHYVQYDQGEDRWLCTLLLQRGYRVEYSAASDAYTHCPESFNEFYNQRRRWVPSTMANIFDLLTDFKRTVKINDNISTLYIMYQMMLMVGTILGPGTIFLMMIGAINALTGISNLYALLINLAPILIFFIVCMTCKADFQLLLANIITCVYMMIMLMVIVGIALQIIEDGWMAPSSLFFVATIGIFFVSAALHPQEVTCLAYLLIYYITIPSMYMLLIIYSLCNLNNITWGTREVAQKKTLKELEMEKKAAEEAKKQMDNKSILSWFGKSSEETSGSVECSVSGIFRCLCCTNPKDHKEDLHLLQISNSLEKIEKRLDNIGAQPEAEKTTRRRSSIGLRTDTLSMLPEYEDSEVSTDIPRDERDDLINPYWVEDPDLQKGEVDFLTTAETEFWKDLIDAYLRPIDENKEEKERISTDLKNLRNTMVFAFLMLNTLFVLVIFLLQLRQDILHFKWPIGQKISLEYDRESNVILIEQEYLTLEPIGSMLIIFFGLILTIQFLGMLFHRFGTLLHLLSTVELNWNFGNKADDMTDETQFEKRAVEIAKDLQRLNVDDLEKRGVDDSHVSKRKTLHTLEHGKDSKQSFLNLDANFKRRLTILQNGDPSMASRLPSLGGNTESRRATLRALMSRRDSVLAEKRRSQLQVENDSTAFYDDPVALNVAGRSSLAYVNAGYEPAYDSDDDMPPPPRRSTVRFRESYRAYS